MLEGGTIENTNTWTLVKAKLQKYLSIKTTNNTDAYRIMPFTFLIIPLSYFLMHLASLMFYSFVAFVLEMNFRTTGINVYWALYLDKNSDEGLPSKMPYPLV